MTDSRFAVIVFLVMVTMSAVVGYACRAIEMSGKRNCAIWISDAVGNKAEFHAPCEVLNDE